MIELDKLELWELWKLRYEQLELLFRTQGNLSAIEQELNRRNLKEKNG